MKIANLNEYYFENGQFKLRSKWSEFVRYTMMIVFSLTSLLYINAIAEANYVPTGVPQVEMQWDLPEVQSETPTPSTFEILHTRYSKWLKINTSLDEDSVHTMAESIIKYSEKYSIKKNLLLALIKTESNFNIYAISDGGAVGLTQVILKYHKEKVRTILKDGAKFNPFDIANNIELGAQVLSEYHGNLQRYNGNSENFKYTGLVLNAKKVIDKQLPEI